LAITSIDQIIYLSMPEKENLFSLGSAGKSFDDNYGCWVILKINAVGKQKTP